MFLGKYIWIKLRGPFFSTVCICQIRQWFTHVGIDKIIENRNNLGLSLDYSINSEFENKTKHKNFIFANGIDFIYYDEPSLINLKPSFGSVDGGTTVQVSVTNIGKAEKIICKFGESSVSGSYNSNTSIENAENVVKDPNSPIIKKYPTTNLYELTKKKIIALGGINKKNIRKIKLLNVDGFAAIGFFDDQIKKKAP